MDAETDRAPAGFDSPLGIFVTRWTEEAVLLKAVSETLLWVELNYMDDSKKRFAPGAHETWEFLCDLRDELADIVLGESE